VLCFIWCSWEHDRWFNMLHLAADLRPRVLLRWSSNTPFLQCSDDLEINCDLLNINKYNSYVSGNISTKLSNEVKFDLTPLNWEFGCIWRCLRQAHVKEILLVINILPSYRINACFQYTFYKHYNIQGD
jgi:hypothetical protein